MLTRPTRRAVTRGLTALVAGSVLTPLFGAETESATRCRKSTQCPARTLCDKGRCRKCTVCKSGCLYPTLQSALLDPAGPAVVRLCAGTYQLHLTISRDVTLIGAGKGTGKGNTILDGGNNGRVVNIPGASTVALRNLRITGGAVEPGGVADGLGGGILNGAQLTLTDCTITGNQAREGGGMYNSGTVQMTRCTVADNQTVDDVLLGGGIANHGNLTLVESLVTLNTAGSGGGIFNENATVTLDDSIVSENMAEIGGGIHNSTGKVTLINGSSITGNDAGTEPGTGGGIFNDSELDMLDLSGGSITGNDPDDCAGICPP
jgi:hypothetical protein